MSRNVYEPRDPDVLAAAVAQLLAALELDAADVAGIVIEAHPFTVAAECRVGNAVATVSWPFSGPLP